MINTILGLKGKMGQTFLEGFRIPVTKIMAGPCVVTQVKSEDKDGYWAIQIGLGEKKIKNVSKSLQGHLKKTIKEGKAPLFLCEVRLEKQPEFKVGDVILASEIFRVGDVITVTGISKGKGFAGAVKRWGFKGGPKTHGQSDRQRAPGSIGATTTPGRVLKGKRMAGRMGGDQVTVKSIHVISIDKEKGEIFVSGPVPGVNGSLVTLKRIKAGSLEDLEKETVAQVVEGEAPAEEVKAEAAPAEEATK